MKHRRHRRGDGRRRPRSLRKLLFLWFLVSLVVTACAASFTFRAIEGGQHRDEIGRLERVIGVRWSRVWSDAAEREMFARDLERELPVSVGLRDRDGRTLRDAPSADVCEGHHHEILVRDDGGQTLGHVALCVDHPMGPSGWSIALTVLAGLGALLLMSGLLAHRLAAPIRRVARVAQRLADGELDARVGAMRDRGEVGVLARVFDNMAERIRQQLDEQRELLAHVSHELRTPLGHLRLLLEIGREGGAIEWDELERELVELDELVAQLLARSRVELGTLDRSEVDAVGLARRALQRQGVDESRLIASDETLLFSLDPTLVERALANLVRNAESHGGGLSALHVELDDEDLLVFRIVDEGPGEGASNEDAPAQDSGRGLGIGLPLSESIAKAHGGSLQTEADGRGFVVRLALANVGESVLRVPDANRI